MASTSMLGHFPDATNTDCDERKALKDKRHL